MQKLGKMLVFDVNIQKLLKIQSITHMTPCKPACTTTTTTVKKGRDNFKEFTFEVSLMFDETIIYSKAIIGYDFSNFLVDLGSSVGLWFGISVLG